MIGELTDPPSRSPDAIVRQCGSYSKAVAKVMDFGRALWELAFLEDLSASTDSSDKYTTQAGPQPRVARQRDHDPFGGYQFQIIDLQRLEYGRFQGDKRLLDIFFDRLQEERLCSISRDRRYAGLDIMVFDPATLVRHFLGGIKEETELRYFVRRDIRRKYRREQSSQTAHFFHLLASSINKELDAGRLFVGSGDGREFSPDCSYKRDFLPHMLDVLGEDRQWKMEEQQESSKEPDILKMFVECCRDVGYLVSHRKKRGHIRIRPQVIDSEYLISRLFGMPTSISGFDDLFGGGGLILSDDSDMGDDAAQEGATQDGASEAAVDDKGGGGAVKRGRLNGRTILIKGRFGTGKSLLSMQLAVEVARKGGLAWIMPLEQTAEECLYTLESMAVLPRDDSVIVTRTWPEALKALHRRDDDRGALIILNVISKDSYDEFLSAFGKNANRMTRYPLRMISVDPINSVSRQGQQPTELRAIVFDKLKEIRKLGTNVVLVAEEGSGPGNELHFEQNIADTVIHLSINKQQNNNYAQRYFEITKSRFQREQRGEHAFSIVPGKGFRIFPSTAAVRAGIYTRGASLGADSIDIEPPSLTEALPRGSVIVGDVVVFQGPSGTFKTPLGVPFLLGSDDTTPKKHEGEARGADASPDEGSTDPTMPNPNVQRPRKSLFIATRDNKPTVQRMFQEFERKYLRGGQNARKTKKSLADDVLICPLRHGYVQPGYILQSIKNEFNKAKLEGYFIDRVMVDNISHWEMSCPFIRDDEAFGNTLLDFLRRHSVTSLIICGEPSRDARSVLQQSIVDNADCVLRFSRSEKDERQRIFMRVVKTHNIEAREDFFELIREGHEIKFEPYS